MQDEIEPPPFRTAAPRDAVVGPPASSGRPEPPPPGGVSEEQLWSWVDRDAPELAGHLERHPSDRARVDALRRTIRAVAAGGPERVPDRIGPYPIVRRLGAGGMGVVFEAEQIAPERRVALKVVRGAWLDDERTRRLFRRETEVLARLQHPGIATIFDAGETKEGAPYFVMELVRGEPLDVWARGRTTDQKLEALAKIARAVDHAHEKGVIHRDLKPSNVLVTDAGEPKVLDFGLARIVDPGAGASLTAALSGKVIGTVRYMSPEQAQGLASRVTPASDVYSLGVLAYELLVGQPPHELEGKGFLECARTVAEAEITRPSVHAPDFDRALERVLCRALARSPERRYASAEAFADDLERARSGREVTAPVVAPGGRIVDAAKDFGREARRAGGAALDEAKVIGGRIVHGARALRAKHAGRTVRVDLNPALDGLGRAADPTERAAKQVAAGLGRVKLPRWRRRAAAAATPSTEPPEAPPRPRRGLVGAIRLAVKTFIWLLLGWFLFQFAANRYDLDRTIEGFLEPFTVVGEAVEDVWDNVEVLWRW